MGEASEHGFLANYSRCVSKTKTSTKMQSSKIKALHRQIAGTARVVSRSTVLCVMGGRENACLVDYVLCSTDTQTTNSSIHGSSKRKQDKAIDCVPGRAGSPSNVQALEEYTDERIEAISYNRALKASSETYMRRLHAVLGLSRN